MARQFEDPETRQEQARLMFHDGCLKGRFNMLDSPMPYDPAGTVVAVIVDVKRERVIRCALNRNQAKNLAAKLMEAI
ncbi:MAG TPA: hypothetical protein PLZ95_19940 [Bryobacteraceae bacterium]|nr:hypothetical protein [Bryobacteraceae bacterium]